MVAMTSDLCCSAVRAACRPRRSVGAQAQAVSCTGSRSWSPRPQASGCAASERIGRGPGTEVCGGLGSLAATGTVDVAAAGGFWRTSVPFLPMGAGLVKEPPSPGALGEK